MTKQELVDSVLIRVDPIGESTTKFHPQYIENVIAKFRTQFLQRVSEKELGYYSKVYVSQTVNTETTSSRKYVDLPVQIEDLPRPNKGVVSVTKNAASDNFFYPTTERDMKLMQGTETGSVLARVGYYVTYDKVYFTSTPGVASVRLFIIPTLDEYTSTENVPLGPLQGDIIMSATEYLLGTPELNLKADNR